LQDPDDPGPNQLVYEESMQYIVSAGALLVALVGLYLTTFYNYLLFHSLAEGFSIVISCGIFMIVWNARHLLQNHYLLLIGIAFLHVGVVDFLHALGYKGMGVFEGYGANLPTQLWIAGRYLQAFSLLFATFFLHRKFHPRIVFVAYGIATGLLLASIFYWKVFPDCFMEGIGLTPFKIYSEYLICLIFLAAIGILVRNAGGFDRKVLILLIGSIATSVAQGVVFTFYANVYDIANMIGHLLKIVSFYLIYKAIIKTSLVSPWNLLFRELELRVQERTAELERANRDLADFNYIAVHDLQEPLRLIMTLGDRLASKCAQCPDPKGQYFVERLQRLARRSTAFIRDIHKYSMVSSRREPFSWVNLNRVVLEILIDLEETVKQKVASVEIGDLPSVEGDALQIKDVFKNLLSNALKFTGDEKPRITISSEAIDNGRKYRVTVKDNGIGFDESYLDKIFAPFQRLYSRNRFEGSGIGLAMCRKILERHGGSITAQSKPNQGSIFIVTLPGNQQAG
jgi:signal transduction histidine kinase